MYQYDYVISTSIQYMSGIFLRLQVLMFQTSKGQDVNLNHTMLNCNNEERKLCSCQVCSIQSNIYKDFYQGGFLLARLYIAENSVRDWQLRQNK